MAISSLHINTLCAQTGFEACKKDIIRIRISCRDKSLHRLQLVEYKEINMFLASDRKACYADRETKLRILCVSV
jgi:hypothetical protein